MNKFTLPELLKERTLWKKVEAGFDVQLSEHGLTQHVSLSELAAYDPRLVTVLDDWFSNRLMPGQTYPLMSGSVITRTQYLWEHPRTLKAPTGTEYHIASVEKVAERNRNEVLLNVIAFTLAYAGKTPYVQAAFAHTLAVSPNQLDTEYPGWQTRLDIVQSLDTSSELYDSFVFTKTPFPVLEALALPDMMS